MRWAHERGPVLFATWLWSTRNGLNSSVYFPPEKFRQFDVFFLFLAPGNTITQLFLMATNFLRHQCRTRYFLQIPRHEKKFFTVNFQYILRERVHRVQSSRSHGLSSMLPIQQPRKKTPQGSCAPSDSTRSYTFIMVIYGVFGFCFFVPFVLGIRHILVVLNPR